MNIPWRELSSLVDSLRDFLKTFDKASKCLKVAIAKPEIQIGSTKSVDNLFALYYNDVMEHPKRQIVYPSDVETTVPASFPSKKLNYTAINLFLHKLSNLTIAKFTISTRTDGTLQTSVKQMRVNTMCSAFTPDFGYDNSTINLIGDVIVRIQCVWVKIACTNRVFNLSAEAIINVRNARLCARCAIFFLEIKRIPFPWRLAKGFIFFKRHQNPFKMLVWMSIVLASLLSTERTPKCLTVM